MKKVIVALSFGTTHESARKKAIEPLENEFAEALEGWEMKRAFTSGMIVRSLKKSGFDYSTLEETLDKIEEGSSVVIQPTHVIKGEEYDKIYETAERYKNKFALLKTGVPLLNREEDVEKVCRCMIRRFPLNDSEAVVLMGHGTEHSENTIYSRIGQAFKDLGAGYIFVGTVEASPDIQDILAELKKRGYKKAILAPLMLVAGDHAANDMAGDDPESWKSILEREGIQTRAVVKGLGEYPEIREIYLEHLKELLGK